MPTALESGYTRTSYSEIQCATPMEAKQLAYAMSGTYLLTYISTVPDNSEAQACNHALSWRTATISATSMVTAITAAKSTLGFTPFPYVNPANPSYLTGTACTAVLTHFAAGTGTVIPIA
jgi:hypothetical protein